MREPITASSFKLSESCLLRAVMPRAAHNIPCLSARTAALSKHDERLLPAKNPKRNKVDDDKPPRHKTQLRPYLGQVFAFGGN